MLELWKENADAAILAAPGLHLYRSVTPYRVKTGCHKRPWKDVFQIITLAIG
jgi:hypothetical protein